MIYDGFNPSQKTSYLGVSNSNQTQGPLEELKQVKQQYLGSIVLLIIIGFFTIYSFLNYSIFVKGVSSLMFLWAFLRCKKNKKIQEKVFNEIENHKYETNIEENLTYQNSSYQPQKIKNN